jgi:hypothetical protein
MQPGHFLDPVVGLTGQVDHRDDCPPPRGGGVLGHCLTDGLGQCQALGQSDLTGAGAAERIVRIRHDRQVYAVAGVGAQHRGDDRRRLDARQRGQPCATPASGAGARAPLRRVRLDRRVVAAPQGAQLLRSRRVRRVEQRQPGGDHIEAFASVLTSRAHARGERLTNGAAERVDIVGDNVRSSWRSGTPGVGTWVRAAGSPARPPSNCRVRRTGRTAGPSMPPSPRDVWSSRPPCPGCGVLARYRGQRGARVCPAASARGCARTSPPCAQR